MHFSQVETRIFTPSFQAVVVFLVHSVHYLTPRAPAVTRLVRRMTTYTLWFGGGSIAQLGKDMQYFRFRCPVWLLRYCLLCRLGLSYLFVEFLQHLFSFSRVFLQNTFWFLGNCCDGYPSFFCVIMARCYSKRGGKGRQREGNVSVMSICEKLTYITANSQQRFSQQFSLSSLLSRQTYM